jgi:hypothetical protein
MLGGEKIECEIVKTDGEKIVLPEAIHDVHGILDQVEEKLGFTEDEDEDL